ncbi:hypothetical protein BH09CHL1_BH09CHL1_04790 [soil metagenome]
MPHHISADSLRVLLAIETVERCLEMSCGTNRKAGGELGSGLHFGAQPLYSNTTKGMKGTAMGGIGVVIKIISALMRHLPRWNVERSSQVEHTTVYVTHVNHTNDGQDLPIEKRR